MVPRGRPLVWLATDAKDGAGETSQESKALAAVNSFGPGGPELSTASISGENAKLATTQNERGEPSASLMVDVSGKADVRSETIVSISPTKAQDVRQVDQNTISFTSAEDDLTYVAETNQNGLQLFSVSLAPSDKSNFSYTFSGLGEKSSMRPNPDQSGFVIFDDNGLAVGGLKNP